MTAVPPPVRVSLVSILGFEVRSAKLTPEGLVIVALLAVYAVQIVTPLRLNFDSIILLSTAQSAAQGEGFHFHGGPTVFPPGYPALVALLMKAGLAHVWVLIGLNVVFLAAGLLASWNLVYPAILEKPSHVFAVGILTLLSAVMIRNVPIPLTDLFFFAVAMWCLVLLHSVESRPDPAKLAAALLLAVFAISIRRIGIALLPPLLWAALAGRGFRFKMRTAFLLAGLAIAVGFVVYRTSTLFDFFKELRLHGSAELWYVPIWRLTEIGEVAMNFPSEALSHRLSAVVPCLGALMALLVAGGVASRRKEFGVPEIFLLAYVAGILIWPFYAARFWLPVLPLLFAYAGRFLGRWSGTPAVRRSIIAYAVAYAMVGGFLLASSTSISFSGTRIGNVYHTGIYDAAYCAAGLCSQSADPSQIADDGWLQPDGLRLLRDFREGRLASGR